MVFSFCLALEFLYAQQFGMDFFLCVWRFHELLWNWYWNLNFTSSRISFTFSRLMRLTQNHSVQLWKFINELSVSICHSTFFHFLGFFLIFFFYSSDSLFSGVLKTKCAAMLNYSFTWLFELWNFELSKCIRSRTSRFSTHVITISPDHQFSSWKFTNGLCLYDSSIFNWINYDSIKFNGMTT